MQQESKLFWVNLEKIQNALLKSDAEFSDYLGLNLADYLKSKYAQQFLPLNCVFECAEKLNFHFEDLLSDNFNTKLILNGIQGNQVVRDKYSKATYSKTRHLANVLKYLETNRGERAKINFLRRFQLTEEFILNSSNSVNILLITDIVQYLSDVYQFKDADFIAIGQMTPFTDMNTDVKEALAGTNNIYETLNYFVSELSPRFDRNYSYKIESMRSDSVIIEARAKKHVIEELEIEPTQFGSEAACMTRVGIISSISWFKYKCFSPVKKISSVYQGDATNLYRVDISSLHNLSSVANIPHKLKTIYH